MWSSVCVCRTVIKTSLFSIFVRSRLCCHLLKSGCLKTDQPFCHRTVCSSVAVYLFYTQSVCVRARVCVLDFRRSAPACVKLLHKR